MMQRTDILNKLIKCDLPIEDLKKLLSQLPWESPITMKFSKRDLKNILDKYFSNIISERELIEWANLIEVREDIEFIDDEDILKEIIFNIANPELVEDDYLKKLKIIKL